MECNIQSRFLESFDCATGVMRLLAPGCRPPISDQPSPFASCPRCKAHPTPAMVTNPRLPLLPTVGKVQAPSASSAGSRATEKASTKRIVYTFVREPPLHGPLVGHAESDISIRLGSPHVLQYSVTDEEKFFDQVAKAAISEVRKF